MLESREVVNVDIAYDELPEKHYAPEEVRCDGAYYILSWLLIAHHFLSKWAINTLQTQPFFTCKKLISMGSWLLVLCAWIFF